MTPREATAPVLLELLVEQGLSEYATLATPAEDVPVLGLLRRTAQARTPDLAALPWPERRAALDAAWQRVDGPFRRLTAQLRLAQHELFLLGLAGGAESSHLIGLALAALQAPEPVSRPGIHLALDLWQQLFAVMGADALDLVSGRLCTSGLLIADGSGPLPQRHLRVRPELWRALRGGEADWPGCRRLEPSDGRAGRRAPGHAAHDVGRRWAGAARAARFRTRRIGLRYREASWLHANADTGRAVPG